MLARLVITDLAIVESCEIDLASGYTVLTGETGAGKSLLIGAVSLLVGERADASLVRTGASRAVVEGVFTSLTESTLRALDAMGVADASEANEILVRREITSDGRSRAWVNDRAVTLTALRAIGETTVDLCGQHAHQTLLSRTAHLELLDAWCHAGDLRVQVADLVARRAAHRSILAAREAARGEGAQRAEFLAFQLAEIDRLAPRAGEMEELRRDRDVLRHTDRLMRGVGEAARLLYDDENAAVSEIARAARLLGDLGAIDPALAEAEGNLTQIRPAIEEIGRSLSVYLARLDADPARLEHVETRLASLSALAARHGGDLDDVLRRRDALAAELALLRDGDEGLAALHGELGEIEDELRAAASHLSAARRTAAVPFTAAIAEALGELGLPGARSRIAFTERDDADGLAIEGGPGAPDRRIAVDERGAEDVEIQFAANTGEDLRPLARIASGGELSRLLLAVRSVLRAPGGPRCLAFDEVDQGLGGAAADAVARRLRAVSRDAQVLAITHIPVLASYADHHLAIEKNVDHGRTRVSVRELSDEARTHEIARMMSGSNAGDEALRHARALRAAAMESDVVVAASQPAPRAVRHAQRPSHARGERVARGAASRGPR